MFLGPEAQNIQSSAIWFGKRRMCVNVPFSVASFVPMRVFTRPTRCNLEFGGAQWTTIPILQPDQTGKDFVCSIFMHVTDIYC